MKTQKYILPYIKGQKIQSLNNILSQSYQTKRLNIVDQGVRSSISGIRATIFGATGFMGPYIGSILGYISSDLIFPHNHEYVYDDDVKELKLCAGSGQSTLVKHMDFDDLKMIDRVIKNSNVVINLCGPRHNVKNRNDFEYINIEIPKRIADACARNENVIRYIHFSCAGATHNSPSQDFATKFIGEQEVRSRFPNATILRPTQVYGMNDYFVQNWIKQKEFWYNFNIVTDDCQAKKSPILIHDVAQSVLNALKLEESVGQTYDLGGPTEYSMKEIYEILHNIIQRPANLVYFPKDLALKIAEKLPNWTHFSGEQIIKHSLDIVPNSQNKSIKDLYIQPISFVNGVQKFLIDHKARYSDRAMDER